jgi:hypothetical protein
LKNGKLPIVKIGDVVRNTWQGFERFGLIKRLVITNNWLYAEVDWVHDDCYSRNRKANKKEVKELYRSDEIEILSREKLITLIKVMASLLDS